MVRKKIKLTKKKRLLLSTTWYYILLIPLVPLLFSFPLSLSSSSNSATNADFTFFLYCLKTPQ